MAYFHKFKKFLHNKIIFNTTQYTHKKNWFSTNQNEERMKKKFTPMLLSNSEHME